MTEPGTMPDAARLYSVMQRILGGRPDVCIRDLGEPVEGPADLPVELGIRLTGGISGFLVLRTARGFAEWLLRRSPDPDLRGQRHADAFNSLAILYGVSLLLECWQPLLFHFGPLLPRPTTPADWPARMPDAACALLVDKTALEIRFWRDAG